MGSNVALIEKWICSEVAECIPGNAEVARHGLDTREEHDSCERTALMMQRNFSAGL